MRINDLRNTIKNHSKKNLEIIIAELYKSIPRSIIEDSGVDSFILNPKILMEKKDSKKSNLNLTKELIAEITQFIEHAKEGYYFFPNKVIPKAERPKWRFKAKNYYKILISQDKHSSPQTAKLLERLYRLLVHGCGYQIFRGMILLLLWELFKLNF